MMNRFVTTVLITLAIGFSHPVLLLAQAPASTRIAACSLLPKEEVKKHLPWIDVLDQMAVEEEPIGDSGSSCNYPSVFIQVLSSSSGLLELAREKGKPEAISDIGDEAWFRNNDDRYAELYVRVGNYVLTIQASVYDTIESVKPGVLSLARALVAELP